MLTHPTRTRCLLTALLCVTFVAMAACGDDTTTTLTVTVNIPGDAETIPDNAVLTVRIENSSIADASSVIVSERQIEVSDGSFPIDVELDYDADEIDERAEYGAAARVESDGALVLISDTFVPVITRGADPERATVDLVEV